MHIFSLCNNDRQFSRLVSCFFLLQISQLGASFICFVIRTTKNEKKKTFTYIHWRKRKTHTYTHKRKRKGKEFRLVRFYKHRFPLFFFFLLFFFARHWPCFSVLIYVIEKVTGARNLCRRFSFRLADNVREWMNKKNSCADMHMHIHTQIQRATKRAVIDLTFENFPAGKPFGLLDCTLLNQTSRLQFCFSRLGWEKNQTMNDRVHASTDLITAKHPIYVYIHCYTTKCCKE